MVFSANRPRLKYQTVRRFSRWAISGTTVRSRELFESSEAQAGIAAFNARTAAPWVPEGWQSEG